MTRITRRAFGLAAASAGFVLAAPSILRAQGAGRLLVVGGGFGGASAARHARIAFPRLDVTLVEPKGSFVTCPYGNLLLAGERTLPQITHSYDGLKALGVRVVHDWADGIDGVARSVRLRSGASLPYDKLILSPGIAIRWNAIEGYGEAAAEAFPMPGFPARAGRPRCCAASSRRCPTAGWWASRSGQSVPLPARPL